MRAQQEQDVEAAEAQRQQNGGHAARVEEGIVTVVSAAEAAAARAGAIPADKAGDEQRAARLARHAERAARGESDHNLTGIALYALSTVFMSAMMILVKMLGAAFPSKRSSWWQHAHAGCTLAAGGC